MIASLAGTVEIIDLPFVIVNVGGVGYKVLCSNDVISKLEKGGQTKLFTYTHVREDALELFGFGEYSDLKIFEYLISISDVGPKTAIGVFSIGSSSQIVSAIKNGDVNFFSKVPRLGKKNAQKIIIELKNKLGGTVDLDLSDSSENSEILGALLGFGYSQDEALEALKQVEPGLPVEKQLKQALKYLGK
jgi:Holliday junction DNA helicase RuvA